jgi:hypothetical protein
MVGGLSSAATAAQTVSAELELNETPVASDMPSFVALWIELIATRMERPDL